MPLRIKPLSLLFLILIVCSSSLAIVEGSIQIGGSKIHEISFKLYKSEEVGAKKMSHRKLMFHSTADYDDAGPNPKHDPRRRPGGKG
ncbi:PREDICTED: uncharacterized protein LOC104761366 isoform X1 [Camelina sativa]|uniref:Uncharacterized protein LOC104728586 isoform X1 n=1 Tax=Camelina sativa TaxID=90675 RepID=A0ABM0UT14_CAMSA|nr:PREDICTED: uncharacterized protein LOC104728586 isoform X1 [Camelina sativa]XP_010445855.1 PREDICTED: uncharacterized protein LOC104728586 isoform X2 [Camelina sativa]XP_010482747.1 PREDICTED: uncharacterized protein LOC104761366 isoform X1 [Camelina sativa]